MPLGRPVVPDEYSMSCPATSSATGVAGCAASAACQSSNPARGPTPRYSRGPAVPARPAADCAAVITTRAPQSATMYAISSRVR
jgi:hypothetical protein